MGGASSGSADSVLLMPGSESSSTTSSKNISGSSKGSYGGCAATDEEPIAATGKFGSGKSKNSYGSAATDEGEPVAQKEIEGTVTRLDAYFALVKGNLGPGVLALPFVFAQAGWEYGFPVLTLVVAQGIYAMLTLAECKQALAKPGLEDLGDVMQASLGWAGRTVADIFVFIVQSGVCCCFVNLVAGDLVQNIGGLSRREMTLVLVPFFATMALLRFVAQLSLLNKLGTFAMAVAVVTGTACGLYELQQVGWQTIASRSLPLRPFMDTVMLSSSVFFAFEGLGIVLPIEREMATPSDFPSVVILASLTLTGAFIFLSSSCGIAFRGELQSGSIVSFLASRPGASNAVYAADWLVTVAVFLTYPLQLLPASQILAKWMRTSDDARPQPQPEEPGAEATNAGEEPPNADEQRRGLLPPWVLQRLALVASHMIFALAVDNVALLVSLFGAVGQTGLGMLAPLCHLALMRSGLLPNNRFRALLDVLIAGFCAVIMIFGTYFAIWDILATW